MKGMLQQLKERRYLPDTSRDLTQQACGTILGCIPCCFNQKWRRKEQDKNLSIFSTLQKDMPKLLDEALRLSRSLPPQEDKLCAKASSKPRSPSSPTSKSTYPGKARRGIDAFLERSHIMHNKKRLDRTLRQDLLAVLVEKH